MKTKILLIIIFIISIAIKSFSQEAYQKNISEVLDAKGKIKKGTQGNFSVNGYSISSDKGQLVFSPDAIEGVWSAFGSGVGNPVGEIVICVAISGNDIYAGGFFDSAGGVPANNIAKWNGTSWEPLGTGTNSIVRAIAISGNNVYAGGEFTIAGGVSANKIARWDGTNWNALGSGLFESFSAAAYCITIFGNNVFVGGIFTHAGGNLVNHIARWDGANWHPIGNGLGAFVYAIAVENNFSIFAGGAFTTPYNYIARWDGINWNNMNGGMSGAVSTLMLSGGNLYAGGQFATAGGVLVNNVARWNGINWNAIGSGLTFQFSQGNVISLTQCGSTLYAGGSFDVSGGFMDDKIAKWDGTNWTEIGTEINNAPEFTTIYQITAVGNNLIANGTFKWAGATVVNNICQWTDTSLSSAPAVGGTLPSGFGFVSFNNTTDTTGTSIMISPGFGSGFVNVAKYSDSPIDPPVFTSRSLHVSDYRWIITQTGLAVPFTGKIRFKISEIPNNGITQPDSVKVYSRPTVGSGTFTELPTVYWSGSGEIEADITSFSEFIFVSNVDPLPVELASFTSFVNKNNVTLDWSTVSELNNSGFNIERREISIANDEWKNVCFVSGNGTSSEIRNYNYTDRGLSSGKYNYRLKQVDYNGNFEYFDLSNEVIIEVPGKFELSQNYPNPFNPVTKISFEIPDNVNGQMSNVKLMIYNVTGKLIAELVNKELSAGYHTVEFDANALASGVYFYRLDAQNGTQNFSMTKKMVLLK
ncbi:MAG TPA: T9SS type A sorting domain-containing protein [Ignavibacteria bacterium]|nr:T9SS type A sorting domain-containing protein [Ignavibacteria bacterium]